MIAANVPSLRDYVTDGQDCLLYEPENAEELAEQMDRLIKDPKFAEKLGENAMNSVQEKWNEKENGTGHLGVLQGDCGNNRNRKNDRNNIFSSLVSIIVPVYNGALYKNAAWIRCRDRRCRILRSFL